MLSLFIIPTPLESNDWINNFLITRSVSKISCNRLGPLASNRFFWNDAFVERPSRFIMTNTFS